MLLFFSLIFIYSIYLASFFFLENKIAFILSTSKLILLNKSYYIAFSPTTSNILVISCIELSIAIMFISSAKNKMIIKYLFSI